MSHHLIEVNELQYRYPDGTKAIDGISLRITHGEAVGIVGANGAGKSTLLSHFIGILTPISGTVRIGDYPLNKKTIANIRRSVGMIFQNSDDQLFMPTVYEDVAFGPLNLGLPIEEVNTRVMNALKTVGALHLKDRPPYKLSGGEKRMVAIASVLSMSPDILVMDEPTSALDPLARRRLINLLAGFKHTKIVATHDLDMVLDICERTIVMKNGQIIADGPTGIVLRDENILAEGHLEKPLSLQACPVCSRS